MTTHRTEPDACPFCGYAVDGATATKGIDGRSLAPTPGDGSICLNCGSLLVFDRALRLAKPSPALLAAMMKNRDVQMALLAWRRAFGRPTSD